MSYRDKKDHGISRAIVAVVVLLIVILVGAVAYSALQTSSTLTTTSSSASSSSSSSTSSLSSSSSLSTTMISASSANSSAQSESQLVVDEPQTFDTLDPATSGTPSGEDIAVQANLPLADVNGMNNNQIVPVVANSWTLSPDGRTYTFFLRNDVYYSNGDPLNAYVVWWNLYRDLIINQPLDGVFLLVLNSSGVTASNVNALNNSKNIPDSNLLSIMENPRLSVSVVNASEVQFHLARPFVSFLSYSTVIPWDFVDPYVVEQHGGVVANQSNTWMSINGSSVGDGPYITQTVVPNNYVTLVANPHYWAQGLTNNIFVQPAKIPKITINFKPDALTRELDIENNRAQISITAFSDINSVLSVDKNLLVPNIGATGQIDWISLNPAKFPLNDTLVRKAIVEAINVSQIQQLAFHGYATSFVGPSPIGFATYNNSISPTPYNLTDAKNLLAQAGYPNGQGFPVLTYDYTGGGYGDIVAQALISDLAKIGVTVKAVSLTLNVYPTIALGLAGNATNAPNMIENPWGWWPDFSGYEFIVDDADGFFLWFHNQTVNDLIKQSDSELNQTIRTNEISTVTVMIQQEYAFVWLADFNGMFFPGTSIGLPILNKCLSGLFFSQSFFGIPYNSLSYTCPPS